MSDRKTVLVLGGGIGGQAAANALVRRLGTRHRVVLVERQEEFAFSPSFLWILTGERVAARIRKPTAAMLLPGVELIRAEVAAIRPADGIVETSAGVLRYDALVISLGAELAPEKVPGFAEAAHDLYTLDGAVAIAERLGSFRGGRVAVLISSSPFKCPAAPYEAAFLVRDFLRKRGVAADVSVWTPEALPMPTAGPDVGAALRGMLDSKGVGFHPGHKVVRIDAQAKTIVFENGATAPFDLLIGVPPHRPPQAARESGLADAAGWIPADPGTLATKQAGVFAIGDVSTIALPGGKALPKAGVFAHAQAEIVAANVAAALEGRSPEARFDGHGWCAVELGGGAGALGSGVFYGEAPQVRLYAPSRIWHLGKVLFEKWWLAPFGPYRAVLGWALRLGGRLKGIEVRL